jgi:hypothetical protein
MRRLHSFFRRPLDDRLFLLRCLTLLAVVRAGLTVTSYKLISEKLVDRAAEGEASPAQLARIAWGIDRAAWFVPGATCLTQALSGQILLSRQGVSSTIRLGIDRTQTETIEAHAWLVSGDRIVLGGTEQSLERYVPLTEFGNRR